MLWLLGTYVVRENTQAVRVIIQSRKQAQLNHLDEALKSDVYMAWIQLSPDVPLQLIF